MALEVSSMPLAGDLLDDLTVIFREMLKKVGSSMKFHSLNNFLHGWIYEI